MWGYLIGGIVAVVGLATSTLLSIGGWQKRERTSLRELIEIEERLPVGHPAKEQLREHVAERARLFADRSLEPTPQVLMGLIRKLALLNVGAFVVACVLAVVSTDEPFGPPFVVGVAFFVLANAFLFTDIRLRLRTTRLTRDPRR